MKTKIFSLLLLIALIFPTFKFFLGGQMFTFNDETQIANFHRYFKTIDLGQFPPRWATDMHFEYGSPFLGFNYQLPYYLGYFGHLFGMAITTNYKLLLALSLIIGAVGMYFLGINLTGSSFYALFAAVLYTYTPYQSIDHYVRGAIGESFALSLFPWLFLAGFRLIKKVTTINIVVLGIIFGLVIISHQPAALFIIPLFFLIFGVAALFSKKINFILALFKSVSLGFVVSAYYWIPVIFEKTKIQIASPFNYRDQFPFIWQLIYSRWTYAGASPFSTDTFSFQIGIVNLIVLALALVFLVVSFLRKYKSSAELWQFRLLVIATFGMIFLMNIRSDFIWRGLPLLQVIQFPWRLLMFTTLFTSILFLFVIKKIKSPWGNRLTLLLLVATILLNISYFNPGLIVDHDDNYYLHRFLPRVVVNEGESISANYLQHSEDYVPLPTKAVRPKSLPASKLTGSEKTTQINIVSADPFSYSAQIENKFAETLTYHTFYYPGWVVSVDGHPAKIDLDKIGAITFDLQPGKHSVMISFTDTPLRLISNIISLGALAFTSSYLIYYLFKKRVTSAA